MVYPGQASTLSGAVSNYAYEKWVTRSTGTLIKTPIAIGGINPLHVKSPLFLAILKNRYIIIYFQKV